MVRRAALLALLAGCAAPPPAGLEKPPASWEAALKKADDAMGALRTRLTEKLLAEVNARGPASAIRVCRDEAPAAAKDAAAKLGVEVGRTSAKLRNPANAPRPWMKAYLDEVSALPAQEVGARFFDLGDRIGVLRPIPTGPLCVRCHGAALEPAVKDALARDYPLDRAVGFKEGELRGLFWAESPK
jgi:acyl-CoA synthetase (NDP forming)